MVDKGVHRVALTSSRADGLHVDGIISQSTVLRVVRDNLPSLGPLGAARVGDLFPLTTAPFTMPVGSTLRQCFEQLLLRGYVGCALVGDDGTIVANVSVTDVRGLASVATDSKEADAVLDGLAVSYLSRGGELRPPVTVSPFDTLASLIELLCAAHVHRVHVVDAHRKPIGVVTMMDVLRVLLSPELTAHSYEGAAGGAAASASAAAAAGVGAGPADRASCPLIGSTFRALSAQEFVNVAGVTMEDVVEVADHMSVVDAMRVMESHGVSSVPVSVEVVVSWAGESKAPDPPSPPLPPPVYAVAPPPFVAAHGSHA
jgi:CBS domain-containing protein